MEKIKSGHIYKVEIYYFDHKNEFINIVATDYEDAKRKAKAYINEWGGAIESIDMTKDCAFY